MGTTETASGKPRELPVHWLAELLFKAMNVAAIAGWALLVADPGGVHTPRVIKCIVLYIGVIYAFSLINGGTAEGGGFGSLLGVRNIFRRGSDFVVNGCWAHYLAFDLLTGFAIAQDGVRLGAPVYFVWPCLLLTLMFGPAGYMAWSAFKLAYAGEF